MSTLPRPTFVCPSFTALFLSLSFIYHYHHAQADVFLVCNRISYLENWKLKGRLRIVLPLKINDTPCLLVHVEKISIRLISKPVGFVSKEDNVRYPAILLTYVTLMAHVGVGVCSHGIITFFTSVVPTKGCRGMPESSGSLFFLV